MSRFIITFTRAHQQSLSLARWTQSIHSNPTSLRSILILSYYLHLGPLSGLFPSNLKKSVQSSHCSCILHVLSISSSLIYLPVILCTEYKPWNSSLCYFLQPPITSSLLGSNILPSTLFSNILNLGCSLNVTDQVPYPHKTSGKITILYTFILMLHIANRTTKDHETHSTNNSMNSVLMGYNLTQIYKTI
jgi:hypothetical protein